METLIGKKVLIRSVEAGIFFGTLINKEGSEVTLKNARRIWYWEGATDTCQIATNGISKKSKATTPVSQIIILNVVEIHPLMEKAIQNLESISIWKV